MKLNVPGPGTYNLNGARTAPNYTFGGRFEGRREPMIKKANGSRFDS